MDEVGQSDTHGRDKKIARRVSNDYCFVAQAINSANSMMCAVITGEVKGVLQVENNPVKHGVNGAQITGPEGGQCLIMDADREGAWRLFSNTNVLPAA